MMVNTGNPDSQNVQDQELYVCLNLTIYPGLGKDIQISIQTKPGMITTKIMAIFCFLKYSLFILPPLKALS